MKNVFYLNFETVDVEVDENTLQVLNEYLKGVNIDEVIKNLNTATIPQTIEEPVGIIPVVHEIKTVEEEESPLIKLFD